MSIRVLALVLFNIIGGVSGGSNHNARFNMSRLSRLQTNADNADHCLVKTVALLANNIVRAAVLMTMDSYQPQQCVGRRH